MWPLSVLVGVLLWVLDLDESLGRCCFANPQGMIRVFRVHVLSVCVKFGCDMGSSLPAYENFTF